MRNLDWDYTRLAATYDARADYADEAIQYVVQLATDQQQIRNGEPARVADIGAGTGKLAAPLACHGLILDAVEPNAAMAAFGARNTAGLPVAWHAMTAESTGLPDARYGVVTFGSSFNVVESAAALQEAARLLQPGGALVMLWNHRDLDDPLQCEIEATIRRHLPNYEYGCRRNDPTATVLAGGAFASARAFSYRHLHQASRDSFVAAWYSHGTLARQAGERFRSIVEDIAAACGDALNLQVPYHTVGWHFVRK